MTDGFAGVCSGRAAPRTDVPKRMPLDADALTAIRTRYGCELPPSYCALLAKGHFSPSPWENFLALHDCEWLPLAEIAAYRFLSFQIASDGGFVPFAVSARRDEFCWRLDWAAGGEPPVVFCERGESGFGYAPHFQGFLFRKALEEFAGMGGVENPRGLIDCGMPWRSSRRIFRRRGPQGCVDWRGVRSPSGARGDTASCWSCRRMTCPRRLPPHCRSPIWTKNS